MLPAQVTGNQRGRNASQLNLAGTGIGSFNDRLRDAVLGGSPFAPSRCLSSERRLCNELVPFNRGAGCLPQKRGLCISRRGASYTYQ